MSDTRIAHRYAKALIELCAETKNYTVIGKQLETFVAAYTGSDDLSTVLASPVLAIEDKQAILNQLFKKFLFAQTTQNFIHILLERGRISIIPTVASAFAEMMDRLHDRMRATVSSPSPMDRTDLVRIQASLQRLTGATILIDARIDPSLVGGVVVEIGNQRLDGSVQTQFKNLRERLTA